MSTTQLPQVASTQFIPPNTPQTTTGTGHQVIRDGKEPEQGALTPTSKHHRSSHQPSTSNHSSSSASSNVVGVHYRVGRRIGEGSFGIIYEGTNLLTNQQVAIKFEPKKSEAPQLRDEWRTYKILQGCVGIPNAHYFGQEGSHNILVIDLLGPSLEDLFDMCGRRYTTKTVCMLARQMLHRVQSVHERNLIYRDIKPDNFLISPSLHRSGHSSAVPSNKPPLIYLIDFGMAKQYRDSRTKQHIPYRERKSLSGTARYMSINTHLGREQSRRDDLEALGHVFMYFLRGALPWQGLKAATNKQKYEKIGEKKQTVGVKELCEGYPPEFGVYLQYVRKLGFEEAPDYDYLRELFAKVLRDRGEVEDGIYDWMLLNGGKGYEHRSSYRHANRHGNAQNNLYGPTSKPHAKDGANANQRQSKQTLQTQGQWGSTNSLPQMQSQDPSRALSKQALQNATTFDKNLPPIPAMGQSSTNPYQSSPAMSPSNPGADHGKTGKQKQRSVLDILWSWITCGVCS